MSIVEPPLGLMPEHVWKQQRYSAIKAAIRRYQEATMDVPPEWIVELWRFDQEGKGYVD